MRRAASRLAALAVRQQRLSSNTLASSSSSSNTTAGTATGCSCLMHRGGATTLVSSTSSTTFRHRFLHSTAALGSDAGPSSNLSSLRASLAAAADDEEEGDTGIAVASVSDEDDDGGSLSLLLPSSPPPPPPPPSSTQPPPPPSRQAREPDFTQLAALAASLAVRAVPGRVDDVVGVDEETVALKLRVRPLAEVVAAISSPSNASLSSGAPPPSSPDDLETAWLWVCWKPGAARACLGPEPPRGSPADGFASTSRLREELRGRVLSSVALRSRWERVLVLAFSSRNGGGGESSADAAGGGGDRGTYGDEQDEEGEGEGDPYGPRDGSAAESGTEAGDGGGSGGVSGVGVSGVGGLPAPDRLLFLEAMGRRSNMVLTDVSTRGTAPKKGIRDFALAATEAARANEEVARKQAKREAKEAKKAEKGKAGGSTKRGKRGAANAAAQAAAAALAAAEEGENVGVGRNGEKLPPAPEPVRIPSFYTSSPAEAAAAASYPPSSKAEAASLGISGDAAASAFSPEGGGERGGGGGGGGGGAFSLPRLIPPAAAAAPGTILALGRSVPPSASRRRALAVGGRYRPPPGLLSGGGGGGRLEPGMSETLEVWRSNVLGAAAALRALRRGELEAEAAEKAAKEAAREAAKERAAEAAEGSTSDAGAGDVSTLEVQLEGDEAPPPPPRPPPLPVAVVSTAAALVQAYAGVSPSLAQELCWAAGIRGNGFGAGGRNDPADDVEAALSRPDWERLHAVWRNWLCAVATARFAPGVAHDGAPSVLGGGVLLETGEGSDFAAPSAPCDLEALLAAAGAIGASLRESLADDGKKGGSEDLLRDVTKAAARALSRARGALAALEKNAARSLDADATRHRADLLVANLHLIEPGAASVEVDCWETGAKVVLDLTEGSSKAPSSGRPALLDPPDLAALLYRNARKQRRAEEGTAPRRAQAEEAIARLEGAEARLAEIAAGSSVSPAPASPSSEGGGGGAEDASRPPSADLLLSIRDELVAWGHMKPPRDAAAATRAAARARKADKKKGGGAGGGDGRQGSGEASWNSLPSSPSQQGGSRSGSTAAASRKPFRRFVSPGGFEVLVGRSNRENDELSLRVASPGDVWLHARGVPGSHAVLRVPSSSSSASPSSSSSPASSEGLPPAEDLEFAAALAAFFSKARDGGKVAVTFTRARNVRKPRGAPAGLVTLMSEKVVSVRPDSVASVVAAAASGGASEVSGSESEGEVA